MLFKILLAFCFTFALSATSMAQTAEAPLPQPNADGQVSGYSPGLLHGVELSAGLTAMTVGITLGIVVGNDLCIPPAPRPGEFLGNLTILPCLDAQLLGAVVGSLAGFALGLATSRLFTRGPGSVVGLGIGLLIGVAASVAALALLDSPWGISAAIAAPMVGALLGYKFASPLAGRSAVRMSMQPIREGLTVNMYGRF